MVPNAPSDLLIWHTRTSCCDISLLTDRPAIACTKLSGLLLLVVLLLLMLVLLHGLQPCVEAAA